MAENDPPRSEAVLEAAREAMVLLHRGRFGVLCTLSLRHEGWPFGSIVPYALDPRGAPLILIARIAEHSKNLRADPRASLLVHDDDAGDDIQAHGRVTLMGRAAPVASEDLADVEARYLARVPSAASYSRTHDFSYQRIEVTQVRYIGGFGRIYWLAPSALAGAQ